MPAETAPLYRIFSSGSELGAVWEKTSDAGRDYLSLKFDDPALPDLRFALRR